MRTLVGFSAILLAACGNRGELKPAAGGSLPPKPYGAVATPTPTELVQAPPQTRPTRSDEFSLPPQ